MQNQYVTTSESGAFSVDSCQALGPRPKGVVQIRERGFSDGYVLGRKSGPPNPLGGRLLQGLLLLLQSDDILSARLA